jgi:hypothetical protein
MQVRIQFREENPEKITNLKDSAYRKGKFWNVSGL